MSLSKLVRGLVLTVTAVVMGLSFVVPAGAASVPLASGFVQIRNKLNDFRIEVEFASTANGAFLRISNSQSTTYNPAQWSIVPVSGTNVVNFVNRHSGKCMDLPFANGSVQLVQWECHGGTNQQFTVVQQSIGWYTLSARSAPNLVVKIDTCANNGAFLRAGPAPTSPSTPCHQWRFQQL